MSYHKRYEDSYLDDEDEDLADGRTDEERLEILTKKNPRTPKESLQLKKVAARLLDKATAGGDKELYYRVIDVISDLEA